MKLYRRDETGIYKLDVAFNRVRWARQLASVVSFGNDSLLHAQFLGMLADALEDDRAAIVLLPYVMRQFPNTLSGEVWTICEDELIDAAIRAMVACKEASDGHEVAIEYITGHRRDKFRALLTGSY